MTSINKTNVHQAEAGVGSHDVDGMLAVLEFAPTASSETKEWMTALIRAPGELWGWGQEDCFVRDKGWQH